MSAKARLSHVKYDIFFLDIRLKEGEQCDMEGLNLGMYIRSISVYQYTPVIFITSIPELVQKALMDTGCYRYILKPYTENETNEYTMNQLEHLLRHSFFRCHRKYLVNLQQITSYDRTRRILYLGSESIPIGRNSKKSFEEIWRLSEC